MRHSSKRNWVLGSMLLAACSGVGLAVFGGAVVAAVAGSVLALGSPSDHAKAMAEIDRPQIDTLVTTRSQLWNAVVADRGRYLLAGPRWAGQSGPQLASARNGVIAAYPDAAWNDWKPGEDGSHSFVNINALHRDPQGALWVVDTGSPTFGGDPLPGAAKLVKIDLRDNKVTRIIKFSPEVAKPGSYVDDIRFNGKHAYLTDAGNAGIIVLDLDTGLSRRVLEHHASTVAVSNRPIVMEGQVLKGPNNLPLLVNSDPLEVSPDGQWLYYGPLEGPWSRVPTRLLDDPEVTQQVLDKAVRPFADLPPMGGSVMDAKGNLYFSDLKANAIRKRGVDGTITTIASDPRLHWVDAMFITPDGSLLMPAAQIDRVPLFNQGSSRVEWPISVYALKLPR